jgi:hypothetical protein
MAPALGSNARLAAVVIALVGLLALGLQFSVTYGVTESGLATFWALAGYFTVLTNGLVALSFAMVAWANRHFSAYWHAGLTLWILIVGVVYHLLLAQLWAPTGPAWWADQGLHTVVPGLAALWFLVCAPKAGLGPRDAALWLTWPLVYLGYALIRGAFTGIYPYPFIDVATLGYGKVALNSFGFLTAFFIGGLTMVRITRALIR